MAEAEDRKELDSWFVELLNQPPQLLTEIIIFIV